MTGVLICTHGNSASELLKTAEMICGKQDNCQTVAFKMGEALEELKAEMDQKIASLSGTVICLVDLKGGTPFNTLIGLKEKYPAIEIITGVNIPMLLELFMSRNQLAPKELIKMVIEAGKSGVYHYQEVVPTGGEEEF
ncbi:PTS sugar transporter subunit IIA [Lactobacillus sp. ESL0263]|uniref:PTS sugar transporter subunit IIA n=1 Tax=Lactobacillus sp. ESL0263 TaxID=2069350 RepID=UPI000EFCD918|nr:PTS sugar transporter subunit IIA [Lactobacillus sp. ESL0263]RMC49831.1 PTS sugar transporter subunit IIA [Lactobacillus sp. ESL0263]